MRIFYLLVFLLFIQGSPYGQSITYSRTGNNNYKRCRLDVIAKHDNKILLYKSVWSAPPFADIAPSMAIPASANPDLIRLAALDRQSLIADRYILKSSLYILDSNMNLLEEKPLALPTRITGVHFLVYDDFFYLFYQYIIGHTIYCMAAKVDMDGRLIGDPIVMDKTYNLDIHYQSQIYTVIYSENKDHIAAFTIDDRADDGNIVNILSFDRDLHLLHRSAHHLSTMGGSEHLSEFQVDNDGNVVFLGLSGSTREKDPHKAVLFSLPPGKDSVALRYPLPDNIFADAIRMLIDNVHKRYILASFYRPRAQGHVEGLFYRIMDMEGRKPDIVIAMPLENLPTNRTGSTDNLQGPFDDYYLQQMHLLGDGGLEIDAEQLTYSPTQPLFDRWNYHSYFPEYIASHYLFYDPYEYDHIYPWKEWEYLGRRFMYHSSRTVAIALEPGQWGRKWISVINMPQLDQLHYTLGYKTVAANGLLYFIYNDRIGHATVLTAQSIDAGGVLNTDSRLKEDLALPLSDKDYEYFPRLAKLVDAGEVIMPCLRGEIIYLARIRL